MRLRIAVVLAAVFLMFSGLIAASQSKDSDTAGSPAAKKSQKKDKNKDEKKDESKDKDKVRRRSPA